MRNIWTIANREYKHYFISPIAYIVALLILLVLGIYFLLILFQVAQNSYYSGSATPPDVGDVLGSYALYAAFCGSGINNAAPC